MSVYLVEHTHTDETCPTNSVEGVKMMGDLVLGSEHQRRSGVKLVEDCKIKGQHRLILLLEAQNKENVEKYAEPFKMVGPTQVFELSTCAAYMQEVLSGSSKGCR